MQDEISKVIVYENGDVLDVVKVRDALVIYYKFSEAEKRAFDILCKRADYEKRVKELFPD